VLLVTSHTHASSAIKQVSIPLSLISDFCLTVSFTAQDKNIPWLSIFRSGPVWAIITAHTCDNWANYTILICIPMYMKEVLNFDIKQVPCISALWPLVHMADAGRQRDKKPRHILMNITTTWADPTVDMICDSPFNFQTVFDFWPFDSGAVLDPKFWGLLQGSDGTKANRVVSVM